jgi:hypothetical protein
LDSPSCCESSASTDATVGRSTRRQNGFTPASGVSSRPISFRSDHACGVQFAPSNVRFVALRSHDMRKLPRVRSTRREQHQGTGAHNVRSFKQGPDSERHVCSAAGTRKRRLCRRSFRRVTFDATSPARANGDRRPFARRPSGSGLRTDTCKRPLTGTVATTFVAPLQPPPPEPCPRGLCRARTFGPGPFSFGLACMAVRSREARLRWQ